MKQIVRIIWKNGVAVELAVSRRSNPRGEAVIVIYNMGDSIDGIKSVQPLTVDATGRPITWASTLKPGALIHRVSRRLGPDRLDKFEEGVVLWQVHHRIPGTRYYALYRPGHGGYESCKRRADDFNSPFRTISAYELCVELGYAPIEE